MLHSEHLQIWRFYGHVALFPDLDDVTGHAPRVKSSDSRAILRDWLAEYFSNLGAKYELKI